MRRPVESVMANSNGAVARVDELSTINKVKGFAAELGGMRTIAQMPWLMKALRQAVRFNDAERLCNAIQIRR
jgi:hypothetical protein